PSNSGDPEGGSAMLIGGSIGGGFLNSGKVNTSDTSNVTAVIETEGNSPALRIDPSLQDNEFAPNPTTAITLGVYADTTDPGYSFYNRGTIESSPIDPDLGTTGMLVTGAQGFTTTLKGLGIFNSGTIGAFGQTDTKTSTPVGVVGLSIQNYTNVGDPTAASGLCGTYVMTAGLCNSNENGGGVISATAQGVQGSTAIAIEIGAPNSTTEQLPTLVNLGTISASSSTTEPGTITSIAAYGIIDYSGTLSNIANYGSIIAQATTLTDNAQTQVAMNLLANTTGITLFNQGSIKGDVLLGLGNDFVHVVGTSPQSPASLAGNIYFNESGATGGDMLFVDSFGIVSGSITEGAGSILNVHVAEHGTLGVENTTQSLTANDFIVDDNAAALNLAVSSQLVNVADQNVPVVQASDKITIGDNVPFSVSYSSYIPSAGNFILLQAPIGNLDISQSELDLINTDVGGTIPFLFTSQSGLCGYNLTITGLPACSGTAPNFSQLVLDLVPKTSAQLGLTGYAAQLFPYANAALSTDATLGSGLVNSVTSNAAAEANYSAFAPDASGGTRAVAISLTDQATGPVAARQRALRMYGTQPGDDTLWGQEFTEFLNDKGNHDLPGYQNRGFGFAVGGDVGNPSDGWYGAAFTFYSGGITQQAPMDTHTDTEWYMLTGYTDWRGKGLFFDTDLDVGYGDLSGHRFVNFDNVTTGATLISREADSKRGSELVAGGFTTGVFLVYGGTTILPQLSVDGMALREEGYDEANGGPGLDLTVQPYYANSVRGYLGTTVRQDIDFGDFYIQPEARLGYRYDFAAQAVKLRTDFQSVQGQTTPNTGIFDVIGPDPERGNLVAGATVSATTGTWSIGLNYDFVRGNAGSTTQVGTISILGRI
ncbi:MAG TPA: autotransporter outer membrane beta-barrel domain-containing protein, partial [Rhizomicrobium sp.]|nr:autotransporter outer membrane beta-barrel domain-containing protein [Rhizomicrobium sp.]